MGKISEFVGSPKEVEFQGQKYKIRPLKVKDLESLNVNENASNKEKMNMAKKMIVKSLEEDVTEEEVSEMPAGLFTKLMNEINDLNGFEEEDGARKLKEKLTK